jgi:hypothetical protein
MTLSLYLSQQPIAIVDVGGGILGTNMTNWLGGNAGWRELYAAGDAGNSPGLSNPGPPSNHGWSYAGSALNNALIPAGNWSDTIALNYNGGATITVDVLHRWYVYRTSDSSYTLLASVLYSALAVQPGVHQYSQSGLAEPECRVPTGTYLYEDCWVKTSAAVPNSIAVCQGNTSNMGSASGSYTNVPDPLPLQYTVDLINLTGYQHVPKQEYPDKSYALSIGEDYGVIVHRGTKTVIFSQSIWPVSDTVYFQMTADQDQLGRIRYPKLLCYLVNGSGTCDSILTATDGNTYQIPATQMVPVIERGSGSSPRAMVAVLGDSYHVFDLHVWNVLSR